MERSTRTPGVIVPAIVILFTYTPLAVAGLALATESININAFWQGTFIGSFIIIAVAFERVRQLRSRD